MKKICDRKNMKKRNDIESMLKGIERKKKGRIIEAKIIEKKIKQLFYLIGCKSKSSRQH